LSTMINFPCSMRAPDTWIKVSESGPGITNDQFPCPDGLQPIEIKLPETWPEAGFMNV
jgi:hypothetical protein